MSTFRVIKVSKPPRTTNLMNTLQSPTLFIFSTPLVSAGLSLHRATFALTQFADTALEGSHSVAITLPSYLKCVPDFISLPTNSMLICLSDIASTSVFGNDISISAESIAPFSLLIFSFFGFFCHEDQI